MRRRVILGIAILLVSPSLVPQKKAVAGVPIGFPAQEPTQLINAARLLQEVVQEAQQVQALFQTLEWAIYNSKQLTSHPMTAIMDDLAALSSVIQQSQGLAYGLGQMDQQFAQMYPAYDPHMEWTAAYANWSNNTLNTIRGTLGSVGLQGHDLMSEQTALQSLQAMSQTPMGQAETAQIGNAVALEEVSQLAKLRQLMLADMQSKAAYTGQLVQEKQAEQNTSANAFDNRDWQGDTRGW